jgi:GPH family glycoside/pentoside/hexuronide:cation symporter
MKRVKKEYPADFKTSFAFSTMMWPVAASSVLITGFFMQYLTDYSGIDGAVGKTGFAAAAGTILLLIARIVDIVDDPLQAWIIDNSKEGKLGKYRKYAFANIFLVTLAVVCVFSIPAFIKSNAVLLCVWVGVFYLLYELGVAFNTSMPLVQKMSYDTKLRTKWTFLMRIWVIVIMVPVYFFIPLVTEINKNIGNLGKSFSLVCVVLMLILGVVSFTGVLGLKEKPLPAISSAETAEKLNLREVLSMFKANKPLIVHFCAFLLSNLVFGLSSAVGIYFLKWYYAADLVTGAVDADKYAAIYSVYALAGLIPNFLAPFISGKVIKRFKTYAKATNACLLVGVILYAALSVLFFAGALKISPYVFILFTFLSGFVTGVAVIPQTLLWTECADYAEYITGKKMSALVNSVNNMLGKAQAALSSVITGAVLIVVGYSVNSETGNYTGDVSRLPDMIFGFGIFLTVVPVAVMLTAWVLYKFLYPITPEFQQKMIGELAKRGDGEYARS